MKKTIIISPSGNFYGSEQVLFDHLTTSTEHFLVFAPAASAFQKKLLTLTQHKTKGFGSIPFLYLHIILLVISGGYRNVYINEGGHIKYARLLARYLPFLKVLVHIRLIEDTIPQRLGNQQPANLQLISISTYIEDLLKPAYASVKIYDPMKSRNVVKKLEIEKPKLNIAFIGRITPSKGLKYIQSFLKYYFTLDDNTLHFHFFGSADSFEEVNELIETYKENPSVKFHGFIDNQEEIYSTTDMVLHLNPNEPLGRIGLEAWSRGIPFICFNSGGCGEINHTLKCDELTVPLSEGWENKLLNIIQSLPMYVDEHKVKATRELLEQHFSVTRYVKELEALFE